MKKYILIALILLFYSTVFAKEKCILHDCEYELCTENAIKDKLRVSFYKKYGETYLAKKIKLHANKKDWGILDA